ncbi:MAG: DUF721 domain-containing protein [Actinomycetota bacterium]|nr:DUF721 domain-containing protein [Actinomycetota bacterium]
MTRSEHRAGRPSGAGERSDRKRWHPIPEPGGPPPRPVSASLEAVTRDVGGDGGPALVELIRRWPAVVGEQVAAHSKPLALRNRVLTIAADEPAWGAQLQWLEADLRARLDATLGPGLVTAVTVRIRRP